MTNNVKTEREFLQMVADLDTYAKQGVSGDVELDDMKPRQVENLMVMFGADSDVQWSEQDVREFMNSAADLKREETLTEFLQE